MKGIYVRCDNCNKFISEEKLEKKCPKCGNIISNKNKKYYVRFKNNFIKVIPSNKTAAEKKLIELKSKPYVTPYKPKRLLFGDFLEIYANYFREKTSYRDESYKFKKFKSWFGKKYMDQITEKDIMDFLNSMNVKNSTKNRYIARLKNIWNVAERFNNAKKLSNQYIIENPMKNIKMSRENNIRTKILTKDEEEKVLHFAKMSRNEELYYIITIAIYSGLRKNNILHLHIDNIQIKDENTAYFTNIFVKGNKQVPWLPMHPIVIALLEEYMHTYANKIQKNNGYLFVSKDIRKSFSNVLEKAGVENFHFHDLRHTFGSRLAEQGIAPNVIKELMAHESFSTSLRYVHFDPGYLANEIKKIK